jgi:hypothetical protein
VKKFRVILITLDHSKRKTRAGEDPVSKAI